MQPGWQPLTRQVSFRPTGTGDFEPYYVLFRL
jgi:hypothetical protein